MDIPKKVVQHTEKRWSKKFSDIHTGKKFSAPRRVPLAPPPNNNGVSWITLNIDGAPVDSKSHTHPSHSQTNKPLVFQQVPVW